MKVTYRGCEIEAKRDTALGGWTEIYWSVFRVRDQYELMSGFGDYDTVRGAIRGLKECVDRFRDQCGGRVRKWQEGRA